MKARRPRIQFGDAPVYWSADRAFAQVINAGSLSLPYVEPYLNRIMMRAREALGDRNPKLAADIALFMTQEGNHYRLHRQFNERIHEHCPAVQAVEERLRVDLDRFAAEESLEFNCGYCEGFESLGIIHAAFFFEQIDDLLAGADQRVVDLWKWHLAEEFEHRSVCYDVFKALYGGYFSRLRGFFVALSHLGKFGKDAAACLLAADRSTMTEAERRASELAERAYRRRFGRFALPRLLLVLSPFYDPARRRAPRGTEQFLARIDAAA
jgi:predicted metal-dependent hydrolase